MTRRNSGLSPIAEKRAVELWNKVRQAMKKMKLLSVRRASPSSNYNVTKKGRFTVYTPVKYSVSKKGRFEVHTRQKPSRFNVSTRYI